MMVQSIRFLLMVFGMNEFYTRGARGLSRGYKDFAPTLKHLGLSQRAPCIPRHMYLNLKYRVNQ